MVNKIVKFSDWFDAGNLEHVRAFKHLSTTGTWPEGFIPDHVVLSSVWHYDVVAKMAAAWMNYILPFDEGKEN